MWSQAELIELHSTEADEVEFLKQFDNYCPSHKTFTFFPAAFKRAIIINKFF